MRSVHSIDPVGQRFGRLVGLEQFRRPTGTLMVRCKCDCGRVLEVKRDSLLRGGTQSCGCLRRDIYAARRGC
jgi:hypothetical protein